MPRPACVMLEMADDWMIAPVGASLANFEPLAARSVPGKELATVVATYCAQRGFEAADLVVAVHATSVVATTFATDFGSKNDARALLYQLEASLPFDAEDAVADFVGSGSQRLGVAIDSRRLTEFIREVEQTGIRVQSVVPSILMATQSFADSDGDFVWRGLGATDWVSVRGGQLQDWSHMPDDPRAVVRTLKLEGVTDPRVVEDTADPGHTATGSGSAFADDIGAALVHGASSVDHVSSFAAKLVGGHVTPWVELRRGALANGDERRPYRRALNLFLLMAAALLVAFSLACWNRAGKYSAFAETAAADQRKLFKEAFPGSRVPGAPLSRLRSEHKRSLSSRQTNAGVKLPVSAIEPTYRVLAALPEDLRVRFTEFSVTNGGLELEVEIGNFGDATRLASALERQGFTVSPGRQENLGDGRITTRLTAVPKVAVAEGQEGAKR